jgi:hypothetical protein
VAKSPRPWIVTPHDPLRQLEDDLWTVDGEIPGLPGHRRRMVIARRTDGTLVFFNALPLADATLAEVRTLGIPGWLVLPNWNHKMDAHAFREHLSVKLLCATVAAAKVRAVVPVDGFLKDLPADPIVRLAPLGGTKQGEVALVVTSKSGRTSVAFGDAFMNVPRGSGLLNAVFLVSGGPKCPPFFRLAFVRDKQALGRDLAALAALPGLGRLIPSHGAMVEHDAQEVLRQVIGRDLGFSGRG